MEDFIYKGRKLFEFNPLHQTNIFLAQRYFERRIKYPIDSNLVRRFTKVIAEYNIDITLFYLENNGNLFNMDGKGIGQNIKNDLELILNNIKESDNGTEKSNSPN